MNTPQKGNRMPSTHVREEQCCGVISVKLECGIIPLCCDPEMGVEWHLEERKALDFYIFSWALRNERSCPLTQMHTRWPLPMLCAVVKKLELCHNSHHNKDCFVRLVGLDLSQMQNFHADHPFFFPPNDITADSVEWEIRKSASLSGIFLVKATSLLGVKRKFSELAKASFYF